MPKSAHKTLTVPLGRTHTQKETCSLTARAPQHLAGSSKRRAHRGRTGFAPKGTDRCGSTPAAPRSCSSELSAIFRRPRARGGHLTQIPPPGNYNHHSWKIKEHPRPPTRFESRKWQEAEEETTSFELLNAALCLHRWLRHPAPGAGDTLGFFPRPSSKYKSSLPLSPFLRKDFTSQKPRDRFVFARILSLCWLI